MPESQVRHNGSTSGKEALGLPGRPEALHPSFSLVHQLVRGFFPII
jgi:hypothetical protein